MPLMIQLLPALFGFKAELRNVDPPWAPRSALGDILDEITRPESPNPVDIRRAGACQGESVEPMAQSCAMVPAVESQQTLKK